MKIWKTGTCKHTHAILIKCMFVVTYMELVYLFSNKKTNNEMYNGCVSENIINYIIRHVYIINIYWHKYIVTTINDQRSE